MKKNDKFWGFVFVAAAILLLIGQLEIFDNINLIKIAIGVVFIAISLRGLIHRNFYVFLFFIAFFCILFDKALHITAITPWPVLGAALLGGIGLSILFQKKPDCLKFISHNQKFDKIMNEADENVINCGTQFGSTIKYVNSIFLTRANISCSFGNVKVYFDAARLKNGFAEINTDAAFGVIDLFIPKEWEVQQCVDAVLGTVDIKGTQGPVSTSVDIKGTQGPVSTSVVKLTGNVSFGGIIVHFV